MYKRIKYLVFTIFIIYNQVYSQNICNVKISDNEMTSFRGGSNLIYDDGIINEQYLATNTFSPHVVSHEKDIEFFYAIETHIKTKNQQSHQKIKASITSSDNTIAAPTVKLTGDVGDIIDRTRIEILYNCSTSKKGTVKVVLKIEVDHCEPFELAWQKICKEKGHLPKINIGTTPKGTEIIKEGVKENTLNVFKPDDENKFMITKDYNKFTLFISYATADQEKPMKEPLLTYDSQAFQAIIDGPLSKGGILSNKVESFSIIFLCPALKYSISDVEVTLVFQNNDSVSLFFLKECDSIGDVKEFDILYTIYWIFLALFLISLCVIIYYYLKRNDIAFIELLYSSYEKCKDWINTLINKLRTKEEKGVHLKLKDENIYEENEIVDIKIKTDTKNLEKPKKEKFNTFTTDYGGI